MSLLTIAPTVAFNVYLKQANAIGKAVGVPPITGVSTVSEAAQKAEQALKPALEKAFNADFPNNQLPPGQSDFGYMGPWSSLQPSTAPACITQEMHNVFTGWGLAQPDSIVVQLAKMVTSAVYAHGGQPGISKGTTQVSATESIDWAILSGQINVTQNELGILYIFAAAMDVNIG